MLRSPLRMAGAALAVALALWAWLPPRDVGDPGRGKTNANELPRSHIAPIPLDGPVEATHAAATPSFLSVSPPSSAATAHAVPFAVTVPQKIYVGEMRDLVIGVGANAGIGSIGFTVQFDGNVLQVRASTDGDWAADAGVDAHFTAEISSKEDAVRIRSAVSGPTAGMSGGSVAIVQIQAVAPGTTPVIISDVEITDWIGRPIQAEISASNLQIAVGSAPPSQPAVQPQTPAVSAELPDEAVENGD